MRSRQDFLDAYADQLRGFVFRGYVSGERPNAETKAREMQQTLNAVQTLLGGIYDFIAETPQAPPPPEQMTVNDQINALRKRIARLLPDQQKLAYAKLAPPETNGTPTKEKA